MNYFAKVSALPSRACRANAQFGLLGLLILFALPLGCARSRCAHRLRADAESYSIIQEKSLGLPWQVRDQYSVYPNPASRWSVPGSPSCPQLPDAAPQLYDYQLPLAPNKDETTPDGDSDDEDSDMEKEIEETAIAPIPVNAWYDIPSECRARMFDFESLQVEAQRTNEEFGASIESSNNAEIPRLDLREIIDLALLNSRNYQSQKEALYQVALQLAIERYDFQLYPVASGNGTNANATLNRNGGINVNNLPLSSRVAFRKALRTGGDVLASFANNILLTFDGPQGFATDVSSEILLEFTQPLIQRDIQFENLTRAERNIVYAARDFARFRKEFFNDFAGQYYSLIRTYRQIEIESQNYFSLVRAFNQAEAEYRAGLVPRFQVDQVEQNLLGGRGSLIGTCNGVEQSLDSLKLAIGIPVETPINIDLTELDELTLNDQLAVAADLINRVQRRLTRTLALPSPERTELISTGVVLIDRILEAVEMRRNLDLEQLETGDLEILRAKLLVESARITVDEIERSLREEAESASPSLPVIFQRTLSEADALQKLLERQLELAGLLDVKEEDLETIRKTQAAGIERTQELATRLQQMIRDEVMDQLPELVDDTERLRVESLQLVEKVNDLLGLSNIRPFDAERLLNTKSQIDSLLTQSRQILETIGTALQPIDIDVDDAMLTALVLRFEMMNQRGILADNWRQIKLAADDLRSIFDLTASQRIGTDPNTDNPFNFSFDESQTAVGLRFDSPLNRLAQRNNFRTSLISYQAGIRDLGGLEDSIKFAVRNDLRNLALDREQYAIAVASAALAFERVVSTTLEFRLGTGGVSARDFLEAQTAYTDALSAVASRHIDYIVDRTQLFLDLELLTVNEQGFWEELYNEEYQPTPYFDLPAWSLPAYGCLPPVNYSNCIRCPMQVAPGQPGINRERTIDESVPPNPGEESGSLDEQAPQLEFELEPPEGLGNES